jgi:origin recognition complex subunit 1
MERYPSGKISRNSPGFGKTFICRRGCNTRTATYTDEFIWEDIYDGSEQAVHELIERVKDQTKATRRRRYPQNHADTDKYFVTHDEKDDILLTPRKKLKTSTVTTPRKPKTPSKLTTPSHKR